MNVDLHEGAVDEVDQAYEHYEIEREGLGIEFLLALDAAIEVIREHPLRWPQHLAGTRRYRLDGFPYGVVYNVSDAGLQVLAVMHLRRKPGYWLRRRRRS